MKMVLVFELLGSCFIDYYMKTCKEQLHLYMLCDLFHFAF
jgi:hypothetical protein